MKRILLIYAAAALCALLSGCGGAKAPELPLEDTTAPGSAGAGQGEYTQCDHTRNPDAPGLAVQIDYLSLENFWAQRPEYINYRNPYTHCMEYIYLPVHLLPGSRVERVSFFQCSSLRVQYSIPNRMPEKYGESERIDASFSFILFSKERDEYSVEISDFFKRNYIDNGYTLYKHEGAEYYCDEQRSHFTGELLRYRVAYIVDDCVIHINLLAIDTLENLIKYAIVEKISKP